MGSLREGENIDYGWRIRTLVKGIKKLLPGPRLPRVRIERAVANHLFERVCHRKSLRLTEITQSETARAKFMGTVKKFIIESRNERFKVGTVDLDATFEVASTIKAD